MTPEQKLHKEANAAASLRQTLGAIIGDDMDCLRDTIEGQTGLLEAIGAVMAQITEDEILITGLSIMTETQEARKARLQDRIGRLRSAIEQALVLAELPTLALPDATVSLKTTPRKIEILDEAVIPAEFFKASDPTLDKKALKAALTEGRAVPGATLDNGGITLQIRRQ